MLLFHPLSLTSLKLTVLNGDRILSTATGFVVKYAEKFFLVTNWHVVTGRHADTGACLDEKYAAVPDRLAVDYHPSDSFGRWRRIIHPLFEDGRQLWTEHPRGCGQRGGVDVVALPIERATDCIPHPFPAFQVSARVSGLPPHIEVGAVVHVIGFPAGRGTAGQWPIWLTGHIATDPQFDFEGSPRFLVDVRTRGGMSGSPVVIRARLHAEWRKSGNAQARHIHAIPDRESPVDHFLGVYSGRVRDDLDLGFVWRPHVLRELIEGRIDETVPPGTFTPKLREDEPVVFGAPLPAEQPEGVIDFDTPPKPS